MLAEIAGEDVADGVEVGAAVVGNDPLGISGGSRGIAERDGVPFVLRRPCGEPGVALRHGVLVFEFADPLSARESRVIDVDHQRLRTRHQRQRFGDHAGKFRIDQNDLCAAMVELEGDGIGFEANVEGVEHRSRHRHRKMHLVHRGNVRQHRRDRVATADAALRQERRETAAALVGLAPGEDAAFVHRAGEVRIDRGGALEKTQRRQRHEIGRRLVQSDAVMALITHRFGPFRGSQKSDRNPREYRDDNQPDQQRKQIPHDRTDAFGDPMVIGTRLGGRVSVWVPVAVIAPTST